MMNARILICDDDAGMRETLEAVLCADGYAVAVATCAGDALRLLEGPPFEVMLLDLRMPGIGGMELLPRIKERSPALSVIMMTAYGTIRTAVEAVKQGAFDFITKPFELEDVRSTIRKALEIRRLAAENREPHRDIAETVVLKDIVGQSPAMHSLFEIIRKVVEYDVTVLITGESGTGKEMVAQAIHHNSSRRAKPFVKLNCAVLPEALLESELFGYEKGAFTGATGFKPGRFELAAGGTIFLDEIGDTSLAMQSKLLRVLQEREFERLGGRETIRVDVRILAATNKDLKVEVREKRFREDLFYRLNVVPVHIPPLRERAEDIPLLVNYFIKEMNLLFQKNCISVSADALSRLICHPWPGNVRELHNVLQKAVLLGSGPVIGLEHLPEDMTKIPVAAKGASQPTTMDGMEKELILRVLQDVGWNQTKASEILKIHRNTLREKIRRFNLKVPEGVEISSAPQDDAGG